MTGQRTSCDGRGELAHTPLRRDEMGGDVCLTCICHRLDAANRLYDACGLLPSMRLFTNDSPEDIGVNAGLLTRVWCAWKAMRGEAR